MADINVQTSGAINLDIPDTVEEITVSIQSGWRVLHRVPVYMREDMKKIYDPVMISLGPYHHGKSAQLKSMEPLKEEILDMFCQGADRKSTLRDNVYGRMGEIRHFYSSEVNVKDKDKDKDKDDGKDEGKNKDKEKGKGKGKDDKKLDEMMLRDACFLVCYMQGFCKKVKEMQGFCKKVEEIYNRISQRLGMSGLLFMHRDMFILENQIPLWLISLIHPHPKSLLCEFLSYNVFGDYRMKKLPWGGGGGEEEPLHLLEAFHRTYLPRVGPTNIKHQPKLEKSTNQRRNNPFRSVRKLQSKGIEFRQNSNCLTDIKFSNGQLQLPSFCFTNDSKVFFSNLIAFEMSPDSNTNYGVTSYFNFMKTLIHKPKDVKVLREKGILYSELPKDEKVVGMFKKIDTYGYSNDDLLGDVKKSIEKHCNNKTRTWMAELINTYFQSPWTAIALAAAIFLLCLTCLQTYFTIYPKKETVPPVYI